MRDFGNEPHGTDMSTVKKDFDNNDSDFGDITALSLTTKDTIETTDGFFVGDGRYLTGIADTAVVLTLSNSSGIVPHNYGLGTVFIHTTPTANFTANVTNLPDTPQRRLTVTLIVQQGATPYAPTAFQINGAGHTVKWVGGISPTPTSLATDVYTYTILRSATTWTILGSSASWS